MTEPEAEPMTFIDRIREISMDAGRTAVEKIDELDVFAVIPAWRVPQGEITPAIFVTRTGQPMTPTQLVRMMDRLLRASGHCVESMGLQVRQIAAAGDRIGGELNDKIQELERINTEIEIKRKELAGYDALKEESKRLDVEPPPGD